MINHKHILLIDAVILIGSLLAVAGFIGYTRPLVISPLDSAIIPSNDILFSFHKADRILIDTNLEFTSPEIIYVKNNIIINLKPGIYYWKVEGVLSSEIRKFTVESSIDLQIRELDEGDYQVVNSGTVPLEVYVYNNGVLSDKLIVDVDENSPQVKGDKFIGEQDE